MEDLIVYAVDIGSVPKKNLGWARSPEGSMPIQKDVGNDIDALVEAISKDLQDGRPVAVGFEAPMWIPVPEASKNLGKARKGEGRRAWSASAGATVLGLGLAQACWIFWGIQDEVSDVPVFLDWDEFRAGQGGRLFVWEAFVSGEDKGGSHSDEAKRVARNFQRLAAAGKLETTVDSDENVFSIVGAALLWAKMTKKTSFIETPAIVIKP